MAKDRIINEGNPAGRAIPRHWPEAATAMDHQDEHGGNEAEHPPNQAPHDRQRVQGERIQGAMSQYLPRNHPARAMHEAGAATGGVVEPETALPSDEERENVSPEVQTERQILAKDHDPATVQDAAAQRHYHTLDLISAQTLEKLRRLRDQIDELQNLVVDDGNRLKAEIEGHVELARTANVQADQVAGTIARMREQHKRLTAP